MKTEITKSTWEDVVFESRNKEYGAYSIRKSYDENVSKASLIALLFVAFVFGVIQVASLLHVEIKIPHPKIPTITQFPPKIIAEHPIKKTEVRKEPLVNRDLQARVVTHEVELTPVKPIETTLPGSKTGTTTDVIAVDVDPGQGVITTPVVVEPPKIFDIPQVMPQYEGGTKAMVKDISKNIHYPVPARELGQEGTVFVRFVVNDKGQVVNVEVIRGVNALLDREAMRVVAWMTKWKPGMQNNIPVNVRMVLPIKFQMGQ